ncbi:heme lyase CcmF/NrfE family subunit [Albidovulum sediminicola]|uniref:Heme lyase CcmF/NrfE family subunit n=1 Tax=Albidovulum sediminicola TaxID=2984331 RepID=A0ABT2YXK7_9RHOB|nr:heme lyase CcmF/NrfE family subunit [Defluviimonas sp. WL0075]MCV2863610.1 heme lyase CcmF/NrfE family subunit [Defluviimonas sp. WL0075]
MTAEIGHFAMILALMIAVAQATVPIYGAWRRILPLMRFADGAAVAQLGFVALAMAMLLRAFAATDLSVAVVANNANAAMPLHFRLSAAWGNHEGSLLLWVLILSVFGAAVALLGRSLPATLKARTLAVQGMIAVSFLALSLFTSNPFERLHPAPAQGMELNPLLQDIGLILHPPFLYLGYVGFSIVFSFAVAALIEGRIDAAWARLVRPWVLLAWIFLTIGITLGSFWAYYELGWGGWWFWDPVENASFMPWLVGTALLHSALVVERRQTLIVWTILLAILTFSLSLIGTFVVRSGVITSVHAFAADPARGVGVLVILSAFTGGALTLFALRSGDFDQSATFRPVSREGALILNNILLVVATATVFLGTFYPLFVEMIGPEKISVGPPYFNRSFGPIMAVLALALSVGPFLRWKRDQLGAALIRLRWPLAAAGLAALAATALGGMTGLGAALGLGLAIWLVLGAFWIVVARAQPSRLPRARAWTLLRTTPLATWGTVLAHAGLGLLIAGITCMTLWEEEIIAALKEGESISAGGYDFTLQSVRVTLEANYEVERASFAVERDARPVTVMEAERRYYPVSRRVTTEAAIAPRFLSNLYVSVSGPSGTGKWGVRVYYHPFVILIWLGPLIMALGGLLSLIDRRFRVGTLSARPAAQAVRA